MCTGSLKTQSEVLSFFPHPLFQFSQPWCLLVLLHVGQPITSGLPLSTGSASAGQHWGTHPPAEHWKELWEVSLKSISKHNWLIVQVWGLLALKGVLVIIKGYFLYQHIAFTAISPSKLLQTKGVHLQHCHSHSVNISGTKTTDTSDYNAVPSPSQPTVLLRASGILKSKRSSDPLLA